jgi:hypothetical protein
MSALQIDAQNGCSRQASGQPASFEFIWIHCFQLWNDLRGIPHVCFPLSTQVWMCNSSAEAPGVESFSTAVMFSGEPVDGGDSRTVRRIY